MLIDPSQSRVLGPLSAFAAGFADELTRQGYRPRAAGNQMGLLAHLSRWLVGEGRGADALHTTEVERFLLARRAAGYTYLLSIKAMQPILAYLRGLCRHPSARNQDRVHATQSRTLLIEAAHSFAASCRWLHVPALD